ncbi:hypothetical protein BZA77DRAFT_356809 [Pyronema omphalodes]|nr:hypothetical protein BZA77DRAFT_356809 [Pyronema omphalodes]
MVTWLNSTGEGVGDEYADDEGSDGARNSGKAAAETNLLDAWATNIEETRDAASVGSESDAEEHLPPTALRHPESQIVPSSTTKHL